MFFVMCPIVCIFLCTFASATYFYCFAIDSFVFVTEFTS